MQNVLIAFLFLIMPTLAQADAFFGSSSSSSSSSLSCQPPETISLFPEMLSSSAADINEEGFITGNYSDGVINVGFLRRPDGKIITIEPPEGTLSLTNMALNDSNTITGYVVGDDNVFHGFIRNRDGFLTFFDAPTGTQITPYDINNQGTIVGSYFDASIVSHGFIRKHNQLTTIDAPNAGSGMFQGTSATQINAGGIVIGYYIDSSSNTYGFMRNPNGNIVPIIVKGAASTPLLTTPTGINDSGVICGLFIGLDGLTHGFIREKNGKIIKFDVPKASETRPFAINNNGTITGSYTESGKIFSFIRTADGHYSKFLPPEANSIEMAPRAINSSDEVVGLYFIVDTVYRRAFLHTGEICN